MSANKAVLDLVGEERWSIAGSLVVGGVGDEIGLGTDGFEVVVVSDLSLGTRSLGEEEVELGLEACDAIQALHQDLRLQSKATRQPVVHELVLQHFALEVWSSLTSSTIQAETKMDDVASEVDGHGGFVVARIKSNPQLCVVTVAPNHKVLALKQSTHMKQERENENAYWSSPFDCRLRIQER